MLASAFVVFGRLRNVEHGSGRNRFDILACSRLGALNSKA